MVKKAHEQDGSNTNRILLISLHKCQVQLISQVKFHKNVSYFPINIPTSSVQLLQYSSIRHESNLSITFMIIVKFFYSSALRYSPV